MKIEEFHTKLRQSGLGHHIGSFTHIAKSCTQLVLTQVNEDEIDVGQSKMGGKPDFPPALSWPVDESGKPLSFVAQINFEELGNQDGSGLQPRWGIAYFFYGVDLEVWGFDPADKQGFRVLYSGASVSDLKRADFPFDLPEHAVFKVAALGFQGKVSLPALQSGLLSFLSPEEADNYLSNIYESGIINKLLGYPDPIQGNMELECELVTNGIYCGDASGYKHPKAKELVKNVDDWQLLLQVDSNEELGMCWGDGGRLYFWIRKEDLRKGNFDKSWIILQCY